MAGLRPLAQPRVLDFDEVADFCARLKHRAGAEAGEGADFDPGGQRRALQVAIGTDFDPVGHSHAFAEEHVGLDHHVAAEHGVPREPHRFRGN